MREAAPGDRGGQIFKTNCAPCHEQGVGRAPPVAILALMSPSSVRHALTEGAMRLQGQSLSDEEKALVAEYVTGKPINTAPDGLAPPRCTGEALKLALGQPPDFPDWGISPANTRFVPQALAGIDKTNLSKLRLKWAIGFPDSLRARSQPAFAGGAIFVGSHTGLVYALDQKTGCARWIFQAGAEVRTGIVVTPWKASDAKAKPLIFFGDLTGSVYALDAATGKLVWRDHPEDHASTTLTAAPTLYKDRLYVPVSALEEAIIDPKYECCTFRGAVVAYDARTGKRIWRTFTTDTPIVTGKNSAGTTMYGPSGAPIWNTPAIDAKRNQLTVGTGDNFSSPATGTSDSIIAMDLATGKINWVFQATANDAWNSSCGSGQPTLCPKENGPDYDFGAATLLATASDGRDFVIAGQKSGTVFAIDPDTGKEVWRKKVGRGGILAGIYFGMAVGGDAVFVPVSDAADGRKYDAPAQPGLYALDLRTGEYLWKAPDEEGKCAGRTGCVPGIAAAITATPDLVLTGGSDGWIRLFDSHTGSVLWRFDTTQSFTTVGGSRAAGGAIGGTVAPTPYHGMLVVPSGYGFAGKMPGNIMLVFDTQ